MAPIPNTHIRLVFDSPTDVLDVPKELLQNSEAFNTLANPNFTDRQEIKITLATKSIFKKLLAVLQGENFCIAEADQLLSVADAYEFTELRKRIIKQIATQSTEILEKQVSLQARNQKLHKKALKIHAQGLSEKVIFERLKATNNPLIRKIYSSLLFDKISESALNVRLTFNPVEAIRLGCDTQSQWEQTFYLIENSDSIFEFVVKNTVDFSSFFKRAGKSLTKEKMKALWNHILSAILISIDKQLKSNFPPIILPYGILLGYRHIQTISILEKSIDQLKNIAEDQGEAETRIALTQLKESYSITLYSNHLIPMELSNNTTSGIFRTTLRNYKQTCAERIIEAAGRIALYAGFIFIGLNLDLKTISPELVCGFLALWIILSPPAFRILGLPLGLLAPAVALRNLDVKDDSTVILSCLVGLSVLTYAATKLESYGVGDFVIRKWAKIIAPSLIKRLSRPSIEP